MTYRIDKEYRVVLLGRTGSDKITVGNSILQIEGLFPSSSSGYQGIDRCKLEQTFIQKRGVLLKVVDTPESWNTSKSNKEFDDKISAECLELSAPGPHVFLFVISVSRVTEEDQALFDKFKSQFVDCFMKHVIIAFTRTESIGDIRHYVNNLPSKPKLLSDCNNRYVGICNKHYQYQGMGNTQINPNHQTDVDNLLDLIAKTVEDNGNGYYDPKIPEYRVILFGVTGSGKSSVGNSILQKQRIFRSSSRHPVTQKCQSERGYIPHKHLVLKVVDTPDLNNTPPYISAECLQLSAPSPHLFLFVISVLRFTDDDYKTFETLKSIFGECFKKHVIVVFTGTDRFDDDDDDDIHHFVRKSSSKLKELLTDCNNRYVGICNRRLHPNHQRDVNGLLDLITKTVENNDKLYYQRPVEEGDMLYYQGPVEEGDMLYYQHPVNSKYGRTKNITWRAT